MGSFAITYDDFTGGHYMGNRSTSQPANTWTGTNTTLDPRGNLIATSAILETTLDTGISWGNLDGFYVNGCFSHPNAVSVIYTHLDGGTGTTTSRIATYAYNVMSLGWYWNTPQVLSGVPSGFLAPDQTSSSGTLYYVIASSGDIRKLTYTSTLSTWSDTLVTSGTNVKSSLYKHKYRLLGLGTTGTAYNRLYYSDATMTSWSATDYYEFPGQITNVVTRSNDFVVTTTAGIYSVTGVLGESINIQEIYSFAELSQGMSNAVGYGRDFVYLNDYRDSLNGQIYAGLGTNKMLIGTMDLESNPPINIGITNPGKIVTMSNSGQTYVMDFESDWIRLNFSDWLTTDVSPSSSGGITPSATSVSDLAGNMFLAQSIIKPYVSDSSDIRLWIARVRKPEIGTTYAIKVYSGYHSLKSPFSGATGSAILSEYWHQKPMVVREVIVEAEYEATGSNASIAVNIIPTGAVDINTTVAPTMTSSTVTAPTESTAGSTIIHRFRADNAGRAYGFKPNITHKGVRIRRVICICED